MKHPRLLAALAGALIVGAGGYAALSQASRPAGYLSAPLDGLAVLAPPPAPDSPEAAAERGHYEKTRALAGTARWTQAMVDADLTPPVLGRTFGCAAQIAISPEETPELARLLTRVGADIGKTVSPPKDHYQRARPAVGNSAPICVPREPELLNNGSYPSGHAMLGWTYALILAELVPARADTILRRGREFGDSRMICGVHFASDVEAGRTLGSALVARLHGEPRFIADLAAVRAEVMKARPAASCPTPAG